MNGDVKLGRRGRLVFASACAACCTLPVLVLAGAVTLGALAVGGAALAGVALTIETAAAVVTGRIDRSDQRARVLIAATGAALALVGLLGRIFKPPLILGVSLLAAASLLALAGSGAVRPRH